MVRLLRDGVCWLLSVVLLLSNGWPVAIQHAHDVGDDLFHHSHHARQGAGRTVSGADASVAGLIEHVHLLWLGWEMTIVPPKGSPPSSGPAGAISGMLAQQVAKSGTDAEPVAEPMRDVFVPFDAEPALNSQQALVPGDCQPIAALPLCDTARHLRSGVQLA